MMRFGILLLSAFIAAPALAAEQAGEAAEPKCRKAEINPVTGHLFCFDPIGAPVEPPPQQAMPECKDEDARGQWSWAPGCAPKPGNM